MCDVPLDALAERGTHWHGVLFVPLVLINDGSLERLRVIAGGLTLEFTRLRRLAKPAVSGRVQRRVRRLLPMPHGANQGLEH